MVNNIRLIKKEDKNAIAELFKLKNTNLEWDYEEFYEHPNCYAVVLIKDEQIIGFGALIEYMTPKHGKIGRLEDILVHPEHEGHGYGKLLIHTLIQSGINIKLKQIVLTSNPKREVARHIYTKFGFELYETGVFIKNL